MNDIERNAVARDTLQMLDSLQRAVSQAGGNPMFVTSYDRLNSITAFELLVHLAPNKIRFAHAP